MFTRISFAIGIFLVTLSNAIAAGFYAVPMVIYDRAGVDDSSFFYGLAPRLSLGYGDWVRDEFTLAVEGFVEGPAFSTNGNNNTNIVNLKPQWSYGLDVLPGVLFDFDVKAFGIVGVLQTNFSSVGTRLGYQIGVGVDIVMNASWLVRGVYIHTHYNGNVDGEGVNMDQLGLGLIYRFNIC